MKVFFVSALVSLCAVSSFGQQCTTLPMNTAPYSTQMPFNGADHSFKPSSYWGSLTAPYPTNSFWTNLVLHNNTEIFPIVPYPYHVVVREDGIQISAPGRVVTPAFVIETHINNMHMSFSESLSYQVSQYDLLSVSVQWKEQSGSGSATGPLVRGSPYVTLQYSDLTPVIKTIHAILSINENGTPREITGTQFLIRLNNGQRWKLYSLNNTPITFQWVSVSKMVATSKFSGVLRMALVSPLADLAVLDSSSETYPTGAAVSYGYSTCSDGSASAKIYFDWKTSGGLPSNLLMMALPHHMDSLLQPNTTMLKSYRTIKGWMSGILGSRWTLQESLTRIKWSAPRPMDDSKRAAILSALNRDKNKRAGTYAPYWNGKELAAMARMVLIAEELEANDIAAEIRTNLKTDLNTWLNAQNWNKFVYDRTWGGVSSQSGMANSNNDFGQGWYNDHHFHYGYFAYAAAVLGKGDSQWLLSQKEKILALVRDYANPSPQDPHFPVTRSKDWFDGHSWAAGLFPFGDSKNQESSSESVNAYYGLYLLGEALGDQNLSLFGRLLLATEIRSVQKYWHIKNNTEIYDPIFAANKVVGVLWSSKVDYTTFFGGLPEYIHGIQMMPFTPITEDLLDASYIAEEHTVLGQTLTRSSPTISDDWKALVLLSKAIINKQEAWDQLQGLRYFDNGNTMTNSLYFAATR